MRTSENINELAAALAKAQGEIEGAHKDSANPFFKSKYADLASVWEACRVPLSKNGLAVIQFPKTQGNVVSVETRLVHSSGQWVEDELTSTAKDEGPQSIGSTVTYLRRYSLQSVAGVAPEDDDGNAGQDQHQHPTARRPAKPKEIERIAAEHGMTTADQLPPISRFPMATATVSKYTKVSELITFAEWVKEHRVDQAFTDQEYHDLNNIIAAKAVEFPTNAKGFEAAAKLLKSLHDDGRLSEGDYLDLGIKLEDAKDKRLPQPAVA